MGGKPRFASIFAEEGRLMPIWTRLPVPARPIMTIFPRRTMDELGDQLVPCEARKTAAVATRQYVRQATADADPPL